MTEPGQDAMEPPTAVWVDQQPMQAQGFVRPVVMPAQTTSPWIALVCGLACWMVGGPLVAVPAIIFGLMGRREAREGRTANGGSATAGMWLGIVNLVFYGFLILVLLAGFSLWG